MQSREVSPCRGRVSANSGFTCSCMLWAGRLLQVAIGWYHLAHASACAQLGLHTSYPVAALPTLGTLPITCALRRESQTACKQHRTVTSQKRSHDRHHVARDGGKGHLPPAAARPLITHGVLQALQLVAVLQRCAGKNRFTGRCPPPPKPSPRVALSWPLVTQRSGHCHQQQRQRQHHRRQPHRRPRAGRGAHHVLYCVDVGGVSETVRVDGPAPDAGCQAGVVAVGRGGALGLGRGCRVDQLARLRVRMCVRPGGGAQQGDVGHACACEPTAAPWVGVNNEGGARKCTGVWPGRRAAASWK